MAQEKPTRAQDLLWRLEAFAFDLVAALLRLLPLDTASDFGGWLFGWLGPLTSADRTVQRNLRIAFPEASDADIDGIRKAQWRELGRFFVEFPMIDRIVSDPSRVEVVHRERLLAIAQAKRPAVLVGGHFSNFEIMAATVVRSGVRAHIGYRAANNPHFDRRIRQSRARYGVDLLEPKGAEGVRAMMRALGRGEPVGLLVDQKHSGGIAVPLFGKPAYTATGAVVFALRFGVPLTPVCVQRTRKARFRVVVYDPIELADTGDRHADIEAGTRQINAFFEDRIRERPAEWFWVHKRWPKEMYKA
jgi:KDO2-lipid IV(A) lauroyltransferase